MSAILTAIIPLIEALIPSLGTTGIAAQIITALTAIIPVAIQEAEDILPEIKNIIAEVSNSGAVTAAQVAQLQTLDAQVDAAFDAAAAAAQAQDGTT